MPSLDRRSFLAGVGALAAAPGVARRPLAPRQDPPGPPFEWGVASFDPTHSAVLLWTRVAPGPAPVDLRWEVARDPELTDVVASGRVTVGAATDHGAIVDATGLAAGSTWWYAFTTDDGTRSPVGRTRTLPAPGAAEPIRLGVVSCSRFASGGFAVYRALADREVDLVVHLGDYIYEDGRSGVRPHVPADRLRTLEQYRARYAQHRTDPDLQALHARHPMVAVWDDHEIAGNAWRDSAADHDPATDGPWIDRLLAAGRAHEEWVPGRTARHPDDGRLKAWRTLPLGDLAELVVLDTRAWGRDRQPQTADEVGGPAPGAPAGSTRTILGADQAAFVTERLGRADRPPWVVLANQVMFHPLEVPLPAPSLADAAEAAGFVVRNDRALNPDQWDGYPQAREELSVAMGGRGGVVVVTGDVHSSWAWEGPANDGGQPAMVELVTPSVSAEALAERLPLSAAAVEAVLPGADADLAHVELTSHGYLLVDLDAERVQAEWWYVDPADVATHHLGAARRAPITVPMHLAEVDDALPDPVPPTASPSTTTTTPLEPSDSSSDGGGGLPVVPVGVGAAVTVAALGAAIAVRRRTR